MTAGSSGGGTPENDDPFAYLYRQEGGGSATADDSATVQQPQYGQPGVPRTSYHQVTRVGQTTYGQRGQQGGYGSTSQQPTQQYAPQHGQPAQHGQPDADYGAGAGRGRAARRGAGGSDNTRSLLIGAVAVVAAVVIGVVIAISSGGGDDEKTQKPPSTNSSGSTGDKDDKPQKEPDKPAKDELPPVTDAASLELSGGATKSTEHAGALGKGGTYIDGMTTPGATVTWKVTVAEAGQYRFNVRYGNAGADVKGTLLVNGKPQSINLGNFAKQTDWAKAWTRSFGLVTLDKGENIVDLTCEGGDKCGFNVDQVALTRSGYPPSWP